MQLDRKSNFKIAFYIRVSTEEQAENPEGSIKNQEDRLRLAVEYKNRSGNFGELVGIYTDAGISAKDMKRPQLQNLLRAIRNKEVDLVMVTELSRLSRNTRDFIGIWDLMREHGCRFSSLREDFDTTNAAGELLLFQLMNLAQFERRQTSERVEANFHARAARGLYNGGPVPVGYKVNPERAGYLIIDEEMAEIVRYAFEAYLREGTLAKAVRHLNDRGYRLRRDMEGGGGRTRAGIFTVDNLLKLLRNKAYIGIRVYHVKGEQREVRAVWPAIIPEAQFQRVNELLTKNRGSAKPLGAKKKMPYILTGLLSCEKCKGALSGKTGTGNSGPVGYYEHSWATKRDSGLSKKIFHCEPHRVPAKRVEPLVWDKFVEILTDTEFMKRIFEKVRLIHGKNPHRKEEEQLKARLSGLNSQIEALAERLAELPKEVSAAPIYKKMAELESRKKDLTEALMSLKSQRGPSKDRIGDLATFEAFANRYRKFVYEEMHPDQKKAALQKFIHKVEVSPDSVKIHYIVDQDHFGRELALDSNSASSAHSATTKPVSHLASISSNTFTNGAAGEIRTPDTLVRSQVLYPAELRPHIRNLAPILFDIPEIAKPRRSDGLVRHAIFFARAVRPCHRRLRPLRRP